MCSLDDSNTRQLLSCFSRCCSVVASGCGVQSNVRQALQSARWQGNHPQLPRQVSLVTALHTSATVFKKNRAHTPFCLTSLLWSACALLAASTLVAMGTCWLAQLCHLCNAQKGATTRLDPSPHAGSALTVRPLFRSQHACICSACHAFVE
jgi:hypothetical protein